MAGVVTVFEKFYFWKGVIVMLLSSIQRWHTNTKSFFHLGKGIQEGQLDKILCAVAGMPVPKGMDTPSFTGSILLQVFHRDL